MNSVGCCVSFGSTCLAEEETDKTVEESETAARESETKAIKGAMGKNKIGKVCKFGLVLPLACLSFPEVCILMTARPTYETGLATA